MKPYFIYFHGYSARIDSILWATDYIISKYTLLCLELDFENDFREESNKVYNQLKKIDYNNSILVGHSMGSIILLSVVFKFLVQHNMKPSKILLLAPALTIDTDINIGLSYPDLQKLTTNRIYLNTFMLFRPLFKIMPTNIFNNIFSNDLAWKLMIANTITDKEDLINNLMDNVFNVNTDILWGGKQLSIVLKSSQLYPSRITTVDYILNLFDSHGIIVVIIHAEDDSLITILNSQEIESIYDNVYLYKVNKSLKQGHFPYKSIIHFV